MVIYTDHYLLLRFTFYAKLLQCVCVWVFVYIFSFTLPQLSIIDFLLFLSFGSEKSKCPAHCCVRCMYLCICCHWDFGTQHTLNDTIHKNLLHFPQSPNEPTWARDTEMSESHFGLRFGARDVHYVAPNHRFTMHKRCYRSSEEDIFCQCLCLCFTLFFTTFFLSFCSHSLLPLNSLSVP